MDLEAPVPPLAHNVVTELAARLADHALIRLPGSALRSGSGHDTPAAARGRRIEYLTALLKKDPGVFLERHGDLLQLSDYGAFDGLRGDYEVNFYLRQLEQRQEPVNPQPLSAQSKNRRLAHLNRLIDEGSFFEDAAMRERAPLLHHQYVGQYLPYGGVQAAVGGGVAAARGGHPLSDHVMAGLDEALTQQRLTREKAAEDQVEVESSSDDEAWPEDRRAEVEQPAAPACPPHSGNPSSPTQPGNHTSQPDSSSPATALARRDAMAEKGASDQRGLDGEGSGSVTAGGDATSAPGPPSSPSAGERRGAPRAMVAAIEAAAASLKDPEGPRGSDRTAALLLASAGGDDGMGGDEEAGAEGADPGQVGAPPAATYVRIPQEEQAQLQADFLELMHRRFLAGEEEGVNYAAIDGDAGLDDDLAGQMEQDAEDAYFDAD